jgi:hypothetical protein
VQYMTSTTTESSDLCSFHVESMTIDLQARHEPRMELIISAHLRHDGLSDASWNHRVSAILIIRGD